MIEHTEKDFFEKISVKNKKTVREYSYKIKAWKEFVKERFSDPDFIPTEKQDGHCNYTATIPAVPGKKNI